MSFGIWVEMTPTPIQSQKWTVPFGNEQAAKNAAALLTARPETITIELETRAGLWYLTWEEKVTGA